MIEVGGEFVEPKWRNGNCQRCTFFAKLSLTRAATGEMFLGKKVYDDVWRCELCQETEGLSGDKLMLYLASRIMQKLYRGPSR